MVWKATTILFFLFTDSNIKLYTPLTNNINNLTLLPLHDNEDYDASFFVEEDDNFPGYVKLSLAEDKNNYVYFTRMYDDQLYLSNYMIIGVLYKELTKALKDYIPFELDRSLYQQIYVNGPAYTIKMI